MLFKSKFFLLLIWFLFTCASISARAEKIATGGTTGTYYKIGLNLHKKVESKLEVESTSGSWDNVRMVGGKDGIIMGIAQADVMSDFMKNPRIRLLDEKDRKDFLKWRSQLRLIAPLYKEEIHFLVRKDDPMKYIHEIRGKKLWVDNPRSGTFLSAIAIYSGMFGEQPDIIKKDQLTIVGGAEGESEAERQRFSALKILAEPKIYRNRIPPVSPIDVVVLAGGFPYPLLAKKSIPPGLRLLKYDPSHETSKGIKEIYSSSEIDVTKYNQLDQIEKNIPTLAIDAYLFSTKLKIQSRRNFILAFVDKYCNNFSELKKDGHEKWSNALWEPGRGEPPGLSSWIYFEGVREKLGNCGKCSSEEIMSGACRK